MTIVAYLRRSTNKQQSLGAQKDAIEAMAIRHDLPTDQITYLSDTGSGSRNDRKDYQRMLEMLSHGDINTILVYRINRIGRNLNNTLQFLDICQKRNVRLMSVSDGVFDLDQAFDRFKLQLFASVAEMELGNISDFVKNSYHEKARQRQLIGTNPPYGYRYQDGSFVINDEEAAVVRKIYQLYCSGKGYKKIWLELHDGTTSPIHSIQQVKNILINERYTGKIVSKYGTYPAPFEAIIPEETFNQAKTIRLKKRTSRQESATLLKRRISCPVCGRTLTSATYHSKGKTYVYYVCANRGMANAHQCTFTMINAGKLEHQVQSAVHTFLCSSETQERLQNAVEKIHLRSQEQQKRLERRKAHLVDRLAREAMTLPQFQLQLAELQQQSQIVTPVKQLTNDQLHQIINTSLPLQKLVPFIDQVTIDAEKRLTGVYFKDTPVNIVRQ